MPAEQQEKRPIDWNEEANQAFEKCRQALSEATLLAHSCEGAPLNLTNASKIAVGAILEQITDGT